MICVVFRMEIEANNSNQSNEVFKAPLLKPKHLEITTPIQQNFLEENSALQAFAYKPPEWAKKPPNGQFCIDVIKNGVILEKIELDNLKNESYIVFGRFPPVDIQMDHISGINNII